MTTENDEIVHVLTEQESLDLLGKHRLGRLAFAIAGVPDVIPINFRESQGKLYFRTAEGSKLLGLTVNHEVAFEIDQVEGRTAHSVIVHGSARELETDEEIEHAQSLDIRPWVPTRKYHFIVIEPDEITGRRFHLGPEPADD